MTENDALIILNAINGLGGSGIRRLVSFFGSAKNVLAQNEANLSSYNIISSQICRNILEFSKDKFLKNEYNLIAQQRVNVVTYLDDDFPEPLRNISAAPAVLYYKGSIPKETGAAVAIVGSRAASVYGIGVARDFAMRFAECGVTVVSGLARGIDSAAHQGCIDASGVTIAVLGCGLAHIYPPENEKLMARICGTGAVISEFPMDCRPLAFNFPRRNRIISGLSIGVVIVEAAQKSGALITANYALEQGREVYAVPGMVNNPSAIGTNELIKQGAKLVTRVEDVLEDLLPQLKKIVSHSEGKSFSGTDEDNVRSVNLDDDQRTVYDCLL
jgi:DNA processing protein